ncbi:MAG: AAA family ATPase [Nocardioides sp.]
MLIWINGPFGGGKTQTASELVRRLPGAVVCDPEHVGFGLHAMTPPALRGDFQDLRSWRSGVVEVLDLALRGQPGPVVVPMTITVPAYFEEVVGTLRDRGHRVHHVALLADREVVLERLRARGPGFGLRFESWAVQALDGCLDSLSGPQFAEHVATDDLTVSQVADHVAGLAGVTLRPDNDGPVRARLRRISVGLRHVRLPG